MARPSLWFEKTGKSYPIKEDGHFAIAIVDDFGDVAVVQSRSGYDGIGDSDHCLALIDVVAPHITLRSRCEGCAVAPPELDLKPFLAEPEKWSKISLEQSTSNDKCKIVLRPDDRVVFWPPNSRNMFHEASFKVCIDDVQVESSLPAPHGQPAKIEQRPQEKHIWPERIEDEDRESPEIPSGPEEASGVQMESTERRAQEHVPAATPVAGSTGVSQVVKDTPAINRRQDYQLRDTRLASGVQLRLRSHLEDADQWRSNGSALSHSASMTVDTRSAQVENPGDEEGVTASEVSDEDDPEKVRTPMQPLEPQRANGKAKLHSAGHSEAEEADVSDDNDGHDEIVQRNTSRRSQRLPSAWVEIPHNPPSRGLKRTSQEDLTPTAKRTRRAQASEDVFFSPSKTVAGYGRVAQARQRAEKVPRDESSTPRSSNRSRRSSVDEHVDEHVETLEDNSMSIVFSNSSVTSRTSPMLFLKRKGVKVQESVTEEGCDFLCVKPSGQMIKSFKLLMSVILGKLIITDEWVIESHKAGSLLKPHDYVATNAPPEWEWGSSQEDVIAALHLDRSKLFEGIKVFITPHLKKEYGAGYKDIEQLLKATGASKVVSKPARAQIFDKDTVIIGSESGDFDAIALAENGGRCFNKDFISISILRGQLDLDSEEFGLKSNTPKKNTGQVGRPRKSK